MFGCLFVVWLCVSLDWMTSGSVVPKPKTFGNKKENLPSFVLTRAFVLFAWSSGQAPPILQYEIIYRTPRVVFLFHRGGGDERLCSQQ